MTTCKHNKIVLLPQKKKMMRCRHCHLTIKADELNDGHCPECFEVRGEKRYDFDEAADAEKETVKYRCEDCGIIIESD